MPPSFPLSEFSDPAFLERFGTEELCLDFLFEERYPGGFFCTKCKKSRKCYRLKSRKRVIQCANWKCKSQRSLTAGTLFELCKGDLVPWFKLLWLMRRGDFNAARAHRTIHPQRHCKKPTWIRGHKLRRAIRNALTNRYSWHRESQQPDLTRRLRAPDFEQRPEPACERFMHKLGEPPEDDGNPSRATFKVAYWASMSERHYPYYLDEHLLRERHKGVEFVELAARATVHTKPVTYQKIIGRRALRSWTVVLG